MTSGIALSVVGADGTTRRRIAMFRLGDVLVLAAAFLSFLFSVSLWFGFFGAPDHDAGQFVGLWVPSILGVGIYFAIRSQRR